MWSHLRRRCDQLQVDTSHFSNQARKAAAQGARRRRRSDEVLVQRQPGSGRERSSALRRAMLEHGFAWECARCHINEWLGEPLGLEIDHINGDPLDNRPKNLRFLCPNCHALCTKENAGVRRNKCRDCNALISSSSKRCHPCATKHQGSARRGKRASAKIHWPTTTHLVAMVERDGWSATGRRLGVSCNAVRKHLREHGNGAWPTQQPRGPRPAAGR